MVQMDTRLPLMVNQPNVLAALDAGTQAAGNQNALMRQAEGQNLFRQYGAGAMQGDQNALAQIGRFDPVMGLNMATTQQENRRADARLGMERDRLQLSREQLDMARQETARAVAEAQDRAQAAAQVQQLERAFRAMDVGMRTGDMAAVTQGLSMFGLDELDDPEMGMQLAAQMLTGGIEGLAGNYMPKQGDPTSGMREYELARSQGFEGSFVDYQQSLAEARRPQTNVTVDARAGGDVTDEFYKTLDKGQADMFVTLLNEGMTIPQNMAKVDQLESLLSSAPSGAEGAIKFAAGQFGIATEGLDELQAAQALISQLVPAQRPVGSGPMSDADLAEFKKSLPALINQPGGNQIILDTMRGIMIYQLQQSDIAAKVAAREMTPAQGREALRNLQNPLQAMRRPGATTIGGYTIREVTE